jgi:peptidoglycan hydrolase CwlO-like protein
MNTLQIIIASIGLVSTVGGGGYWVADTLGDKADKSEVIAVSLKAEYIMDKQIESLYAQIVKIESKPHKTPDDIQQLQYLREELQRLREIRQRR